MHTTLHPHSALLIAVLEQNELTLCDIIVFSYDQLHYFFPFVLYSEHQLC